MLESKFQNTILKKALKQHFPEAIVQKNDPVDNQGFPDLTILLGPRYAVLEVKKSEAEYISEQGSREAYMKDSRRHNQRYYIEKINNVGFAAFIYPENMDDIIEELHRFFGGSGNNCYYEYPTKNDVCGLNNCVSNHD